MDKAENEIIELGLQGDRDAYRVLMESHYQFAFRLACRITGDADDAEEVTQEAFLRACTQLSTFRQDSSFSTWVNLGQQDRHESSTPSRRTAQARSWSALPTAKGTPTKCPDGRKAYLSG